MNINRFEEVNGSYVENIQGQDEYGYYKSDFTDFYEVKGIIKERDYKGDNLKFYDYKNKKTYEPYGIQKNISYGKPIYSKGDFYFVQADFGKNKVSIVKYHPEKEKEIIFDIPMKEVNIYNLSLVGDEKIYLISQDIKLNCYYPVKFNFALKVNESVITMEKDRIYISAWMEDGVIDGEITDDYKYYEKFVIRDFEGNLISEEIGSISRRQDGSWWLS